MYQVSVSFFNGYGQIAGGCNLSLNDEHIGQDKIALVGQLVEQQRAFPADELGRYHALVEISRHQEPFPLGKDFLIFDREIQTYLRDFAIQHVV